MHFVRPKTIEQQDLQSLHRIRSLLVQERTAIANQIRGLLLEYGITIAQGIHNIKKSIVDILEDGNNDLNESSRQFFRDLYEQIELKTKKIQVYEQLIESIFK
jgi:transposase